MNDQSSQSFPWSLSFPSQINFHPHGHLICTPISLLAGTAYLNLNHSDASAGMQNKTSCIQNIFTPRYVQEIMEVSHQFYSEVFSKKGLPLMIQEMYPWIPPTVFSMKEAAGLIFLDSFSPSIHRDANNDETESLVLKSLFALIKDTLEECRHVNQKAVIIVTAKGHTICFMCSDSGEELFLFDSLPATLLSLPFGMIQQHLMQQFGVTGTHDTEYSALILRNHE
jgi:hypothetical protein